MKSIHYIMMALAAAAAYYFVFIRKKAVSEATTRPTIQDQIKDVDLVQTGYEDLSPAHQDAVDAIRNHYKSIGI